MNNERLKLRIKKLPKNPGVYIFKNSAGTPLYIGKASNLKSRVLAYARTDNPRLDLMVRQAKNLDFIETGSDIEALILESQLIKRRQPRFNIMLRDDKQYFYVGFTSEKFPRIFLTHQPFDFAERRRRVVLSQSKNNCPASLRARPYYIGPFTDGAALKTTLRLLRRLFPYCTCKQKHHVRCLNAHIGKCLGICCVKKIELGDEKKELRKYGKNIKAIKDILSGKREAVIKRLQKKRPESAWRLARVFENATIVKNLELGIMNYDARNNRKALANLRKILGMNTLLFRIEGYDIANISGSHAAGSMVVFEDGLPDKNEYRKFNITSVAGSNDTAMLHEILTRRLNHPEWPLPDLMIIDGGKAQLNVALTAVSSKLKAVTVIALTKNDRHRGESIVYKVRHAYHVIPLHDLPTGVKNLILAVDAEAHRFAISQYRRRHGSAMLNLQ